MMKKYFYTACAALAATCLSSCMEIDNFDGPDARISGRIIDATTGENLVTDQDYVHIRIWERSYREDPTYQDLSVMADGNYNNSKMFSGTYDMVPNDGCWWPCDTVKDVRIEGHAVQDFEVTPYLVIKDFKAELNGTILTMSCRLHAPITQGLPNVREVRPFISTRIYCGDGNKIDYYYNDNYCVKVNKPWSEVGDMTTGEGNETYTITGMELKPGRTYYVRMGANVEDMFNKFAYSEIVKIEVPR